MAPISLSLQGAIDYPDVTSPPAFEEAVFEFDRNGAIDATGLPACGKALLKALRTEAARRRCRDSIVGLGTAHVAIPTFSPTPIPLRLTLFNGGVRGGTTTLLIHTSIAAPTPESLITVVKIKRVENGRYGLKAVAKIPKIAAGEGLLLDFSFEIERSRGGATPEWHYAMARCFDEHLQVRIMGVFEDGTRIVDSVVRSCTPIAAPAASSAG